MAVGGADNQANLDRGQLTPVDTTANEVGISVQNGPMPEMLPDAIEVKKEEATKESSFKSKLFTLFSSVADFAKTSAEAVSKLVCKTIIIPFKELRQKTDTSTLQLNEQIAAFQKVDSFDDSEMRSDSIRNNGTGVFGRAPPIKDLSIQELTKSLHRLVGKVDVFIDGQAVMAKTNKSDSDPAKTQEERAKEQAQKLEKGIGALLDGASRLVGKQLTNEERSQKLNKLKKFENQDAEDLQPFASNGVKNVANSEILVMKFVTKELASYATAPLHAQLERYSRQNGIDPILSVGMIDQALKIEVTKGDAGIHIHSEFPPIPLKLGLTVVGYVSAKLETDVDTNTGETKVATSHSEIRFEEGVKDEVKKQFLTALNGSMPRTRHIVSK